MANKLPLLGDDFEIWGHWWLPDTPDNKMAGRLTSKFGTLELKLLQPFPAINAHDRDAVAPVIHGVGDTKLFTLWDASEAESKDETKLLNLVSKLKLVTRIVLLKHFGIDEKIVVRRALENKRLYFQEWKSLSVEE